MVDSDAMSTAASESPQVAAAHALDAAGRHQEALNTLARATKDGDVAAMSELGHRLLVGRHAPMMPADAIRLIRDAAGRRDPNALLRMAALTAGGAFVQQDWKAAFAYLAEAAEAGSPLARGQLEVLAAATSRAAEGTVNTPSVAGIAGTARVAEGPSPSTTVSSPSASTLSWRQRSEAIDIAAWLNPPSGENLVPDGRVVRFERLAPDAVCAWLIERSRSRLERARVYDSVNSRETTNETRSNSSASFDLASVDVVQFLLQARMAAACHVPWTHMEAPTILHYAQGEEIRNHFDFVDPNAPNYAQLLREQGQRTITFLVYLNEDYQAGETDFPELGLSHRGQRGSALYFRNSHPDGKPDFRMVHAGRPPMCGEKWIVSQFVRSVPLRT